MPAYIMTLNMTLPCVPMDLDDFYDYVNDAVEYLSSFAGVLNAINFKVFRVLDPWPTMDVHIAWNLGKKREKALKGLIGAIHDLLALKYPEAKIYVKTVILT